MTRRAFDLIATEKRADELAIKAALLAVRAYWLSRLTVRDWRARWR